MDPDNVIEIKNISKTFKLRRMVKRNGRDVTVREDNKVIDDLSLNIRKGDVLGILGRNGSGKSTFLKIVARIMDPDTGSVEVKGKIASILELGMGFHPDMSGRDNIYLKGELYGFSKKELDQKMDSIIKYSGIGRHIDNPVRTYSSGMVGRLAFAVMVNVDADILLVDEVLSVGDVAFAAKASDHFKRLARSGKTILFVSHNLEVMQQMCNRAIWIEGGKIVKEGSPKKVCPIYRNELAEAPDIVLDLAESGVPDAQYKLALMYRDGTFFEKDESKYREWIKTAAEQGQIRAQVEYADLLYSNGSVEEKEDAIQFYLSAANRNDEEARVKLSHIYGGQVDDSRAKLVEVYRQFAQNGGNLWEYRYADVLLKTAWTRDDKKKAFAAFVKAAEDGNATAMYQAAIMCRDGNGTVRDYKRMERFLQDASDNGNVQAMIVLGDFYYNGSLLEKDDEKAFGLYLKAAELGNAKAEYQVAQMYREGEGTDADMAASNYWASAYSNAPLNWYYYFAAERLTSVDKWSVNHHYKKSSEQNNIPAIWNLLHLTDQNESSCRSLIDRLRLFGDASFIDAIIRLGNMYYEGNCVDKDIEKAVFWYKKGAESENVVCMYRLGEIYRDIICDNDQAIKWFTHASLHSHMPSLFSLVTLSYSVEGVESEIYKGALAELISFAECGNVEAILRLGNMYYEGNCVDKDIEKAISWYNKGIGLGSSTCRQKLDLLKNKK